MENLYLDWDKMNFGFILRNWIFIKSDFQDLVVQEKVRDIKIYQGQGGLNVILSFSDEYKFDFSIRGIFEEYILNCFKWGSDLFRIRHEIEKRHKSEYGRINRFWIEKNGVQKKLIMRFHKDNIGQIDNLKNYIKTLGVEKDD